MWDLHEKSRRVTDGIARQLLRLQTRGKGERKFVAKMETDGNVVRVESSLHSQKCIGSAMCRRIIGQAQMRSAHDLADSKCSSLTGERHALFKRCRSIVDTRKQM